MVALEPGGSDSSALMTAPATFVSTCGSTAKGHSGYLKTTAAVTTSDSPAKPNPRAAATHRDVERTKGNSGDGGTLLMILKCDMLILPSAAIRSSVSLVHASSTSTGGGEVRAQPHTPRHS